MPRTGMPRYAICCAVHRRPLDIIFGRKGNTKTTIRPKAAKSNFSTLFQVEFEQKIIHSQNQDSAKRYHFFNTFSSRI